MSDDEMMLNIVQPSSSPKIGVEFKRKDPRQNKRKREDYSQQKEPANKIRKTDHPQTTKISEIPTTTPRNTKKQTKDSNIRGKLSKDLSVSKQTKQEIAEKRKEIFEESEGGFDIINARMKENLEKYLKITRPTKIQLKSMPHILTRNDV